MGEIRPKKCEGRELTKDQLAEKGGLCCHGGSGCGPHSEAAPPANATFAQAKATCDALPNCSSFCFSGPESDLKPTSPVPMMWKTSAAGFTPNPTPVGANAIMVR